MSRSPEQRWHRATQYLARGEIAPARAQLEAMRAVAPQDARTQLLAAKIAWRENRVGDAARYALDAARVATDDLDVLCELVEILRLAGESAAAHGLLEHPGWQRMESTDTLLRYATARQAFGEHARALAAFDRLIATHPDNGALHCHRGQQLEFLGRLQEAEAEYAACLALAPGYADAAYYLVRLRRQTSGDHRLAMIESGLQRVHPGSREQASFEFARYHVLEDLGQTEAAWQALATANAVMYARAAADAARELEGMRHFCERVSAHRIRAATTQPGGPCPIFVLGLPRSGTTVLERMLANHSQIAGAGELKDFSRQLMRAAGTGADYSAAFFERLLTLDLAEVGAGYRAQTRWRAQGRSHYVDKQPANWMLAGLIHAALPEAKILHLLRDPMDACFSMWRARFGNTHAWSYDFGTLSAYYDCYHRLMRYWHSAYPDAILDVSYADLVQDPAATLGEVLEFCGLEWEAGCEDLARNTTSVSTLSSAQVREPLHTRGLGHWRRYARQLDPLRRDLPPGV
jgi:tetratricopeptide (TPR) repeat protein